MLKWVCALAGVQGDVRFTAEELPCLCTRMQREGAHTHTGAGRAVGSALTAPRCPSAWPWERPACTVPSHGSLSLQG